MKKDRIKKKNLIIIGAIIFFFILIYILETRNKNYSKIEEITHEIGSYFEKILIFKQEPLSNNIINGINNELENEVNELKKILELDNSNYKLIHASVIKRNNDWYQELTIDKGKKDGINLDMAVISSNGLIGRVIKTTNSSSVIKLLSASGSDMKVSVTINTNNDSIYGLIDDYLESERLIRVNNVSKMANVELGNKVYTSGLGELYPAGIYIGEVVEINEDELGLNKILKVKADTSYDNIKFVSVIDRSK